MYKLIYSTFGVKKMFPAHSLCFTLIVLSAKNDKKIKFPN